MKIPEWFRDKPESDYHVKELADLEDFLTAKGFRLESADRGWAKRDIASIYFSIIAETKMAGYYDCIRTWAKLKADKSIDWCIQIPAQGAGPARELFRDTEKLRALKYRETIKAVLKIYKVRQLKEPVVKQEQENQPQQMSLF